MSARPHTEGPWFYLDLGTVETEDGKVIAECVDPNNGELLAAAPDLLAAIRTMLETPGMIKGREQAEAALARATS